MISLCLEKKICENNNIINRIIIDLNDDAVSHVDFRYTNIPKRTKTHLHKNAMCMVDGKRRDSNSKTGGDRKHPAGIMVSSGTRGDDGNDTTLCKYTREEQKDVLRCVRKHFEKHGFGEAAYEIEQTTKERGGFDVFPELWGLNPFSAFMVVSENLANESHVDCNDDSRCIAVFHTHKRCQHDNIVRYFLLPDVEVWDGVRIRKGVAIEIVDGLIISWEGDKVRHCSSVPIIQGKPRGFGTFFCSAGRTNKRSLKRDATTFNGSVVNIRNVMRRAQESDVVWQI